MPSAKVSDTQPKPTQPAMPSKATIFLIRHAEKPKTGPGLSPAGKRRAKAYVKYLRNLKNRKGKTIRWDYLFACQMSDKSNRPLLTIKPLAKKLGMKVNNDYMDKGYAELVTHLQENAKRYADSNILICWHHGEILQLAAAMGASSETLPSESSWPDKWPPTVFGWLLKIYYRKDGTIRHKSTQAINEHLMPDDTVDPVYGG